MLQVKYGNTKRFAAIDFCSFLFQTLWKDNKGTQGLNGKSTPFDLDPEIIKAINIWPQKLFAANNFL